MQIPDDVREIIERLVQESWDKAVSMQRHAAVHQAIEDKYKLRRWLDSLPAAPEPDWSDVDEAILYHAIAQNGAGYYHEQKPYMEDVYYWRGGYWESDGVQMASNITVLPIGIDWRTTLRRRPRGA